jgi:c-di-GMP-binding flagellar brake protein YcgR
MKRLIVSDMNSRAADEDTRNYRRVGDSLLVSYTISDEIPAEYTETYDIGIGGLAMLTNASLPVEQGLVIELELRGDATPKLRLSGSVRWSRHDTLLGKYRTGVEFINRDERQEHELLRYVDTIRRLRDLGVL